MSETWRLFTAVELTQEIKDRIVATADLLAGRGWNARWVKPDRAHMTVRFYGDTSTDVLPRLQAELESAVASIPGFATLVSGAGAFPAPHRPRVVWLGVDDPPGLLTPLKTAVERASGRAGLGEEPGPYTPHLTVGRLNPHFRITGAEAAGALEEASQFEPIPLRISDVTLFRSQLGRGGAQYTVIGQFPLGDPLSDPEADEDSEEGAP